MLLVGHSSQQWVQWVERTVAAVLASGEPGLPQGGKRRAGGPALSERSADPPQGCWRMRELPGRTSAPGAAAEPARGSGAWGAAGCPVAARALGTELQIGAHDAVRAPRCPGSYSRIKGLVGGAACSLKFGYRITCSGQQGWWGGAADQARVLPE